MDQPKLTHYSDRISSLRAFIDWVDGGRYMRGLYLLYSNSEKIKSQKVTQKIRFKTIH